MSRTSQKSDTPRVEVGHALAKGVVLFFDTDPAGARSTLTGMVDKVLSLFEQSDDDSSVPGFVKRTKTQWSKFIQDATFESTEKFSAIRSTAKQFKLGRILLMGSSPSPGCLNLPTFLYGELPPATDDESIRSLLIDAIATEDVFLGMSDQVLADNPKDYPKSASGAVKKVIKEQLSVKRAEDTWLNPEYRASLARDPVRIFDGPNRITAVSSAHVEEHLKHLNWEGLLPIWRQDIQTCIVLEALSEEHAQQLARAIEPSIFPISTPKMFWKPDAWEQYRNRVLCRGK